MSPAEQIAAINRKRADEHRRVDLLHDQLIQQARDRCVHEWVRIPIRQQQVLTPRACLNCGKQEQGA